MCLLVRDSTAAAARLPVMVIAVLGGEGGWWVFGFGLVWSGTDTRASLSCLGGMTCVGLNRGCVCCLVPRQGTID